MERREDLIRAEDEGWAELNALIDHLSEEQLQEPGLTPGGWSVKDLMWHVACWSAACASRLEEMRLGTFEETEVDEDVTNREWFEVSRGLDLETVRAAWTPARKRMLREFGALEELPPSADQWFEETGPIHYADHLRDLRPWVERLTSTA